MNTPMTILGIAGSLRSGSINRAALRAAQNLLPEGVRLEVFELDGIPPFNQDEESRPPAKVADGIARGGRRGWAGPRPASVPRTPSCSSRLNTTTPFPECSRTPSTGLRGPMAGDFTVRAPPGGPPHEKPPGPPPPAKNKNPPEGPTRPRPPWEGKPAAIMGASPGATGTARAQYHLRQVFVFLNMFKPAVFTHPLKNITNK